MALLEENLQWYAGAGGGDGALLSPLRARRGDRATEPPLDEVLVLARVEDNQLVTILALDALATAERRGRRGRRTRHVLLAEADALHPAVAHLLDDAGRPDRTAALAIASPFRIAARPAVSPPSARRNTLQSCPPEAAPRRLGDPTHRPEPRPEDSAMSTTRDQDRDRRAGRSLTQRLARAAAALHPWRVVVAWGLVLVASVVLIGTLLGSAFTSDASLTTDPDSARAEPDHRRQLRSQGDRIDEAVIIHSGRAPRRRARSS